MRQLLGQSAKLRLGIALTLLIIVLALIEPLIQPLFIGTAGPRDYGVLPPMEAPSLAHPLGAGPYGHDLFVLLLYALRDSLMIGGMAGCMAVGIGIVVGFTAGYKGGKVDSLLRSITDMVLVIPTLPLLIILVSMVRVVDVFTLAFVLSIFGWAGRPGPSGRRCSPCGSAPTSRWPSSTTRATSRSSSPSWCRTSFPT